MYQERTSGLERISETVETLGWLADMVPVSSEGSKEARMVDALCLARSYIVEFAVHRSLGASDLEATAATARRELILMSSGSARRSHTEASGPERQ